MKKYSNHSILLAALSLLILMLPSIESQLDNKSDKDFIPMYEIMEDGSERFIRYVPVMKEYVPDYNLPQPVNTNVVADSKVKA